MSLDTLPPPGEFRTTEEIRDARFAEKLAARRRALLLWSLPVVAIAFLAALKLLSAVAINLAGTSAYDNQNHNTAAERFAALEYFNWVEPWKPFFNQGTAIYASGAFFNATQELATALDLVPKAPDGEPRGTEECMVRTNYSLALEGLGDEAMVARDFATSTDYYDQAQEMLSDCGESGGNGGEEAQEAEDRQQESQEQSQQQQEQQEQRGDPGEDPSQSPSQDPSASQSGDPSQDPSASQSGEPSQDPSASQSGQSGDPTESGTGSGESPSESPSESRDPRQEELQSRNSEAQQSRDADEQASGGGNGSGQNW